MTAIKVTMMKDFNPKAFKPVKENLGGYKSDEQLKVARNARNELLIGGSYVGEYPKCDGDELCGKDATTVITMVQHHDVSFSKRMPEITTTLRNFMLLCPDCLELYKATDTMIGEPVDLSMFARDAKEKQ